ncbi:MAG: alpha/beta fold hydrolase, partial [Pseudomonadota bacterium]
MKKILIGFVVVLGALAMVFALGPREPVEETIAAFDAPPLADLDTYLLAEDAKVANLRDGSERNIVWADPTAKAKTPLAVVYLHGFSANPREVRPLPDMVAEDLGANLYFARLTGHGRDGAAMAEPTANDWLNDTAQAIAIGRALGEKVILVSTSTGGTLATWALSKPELAQGVAGNVMISPNFGVQAAGSGILTMPWARQILPMIFGEERAFEPINEEHGK